MEKGQSTHHNLAMLQNRKESATWVARTEGRSKNVELKYYHIPLTVLATLVICVHVSWWFLLDDAHPHYILSQIQVQVCSPEHRILGSKSICRPLATKRPQRTGPRHDRSGILAAILSNIMTTPKNCMSSGESSTGLREISQVASVDIDCNEGE